MTEKEKAVNGLLYDANYNLDLRTERLKCADLCYTYNQLLPSAIEEKEALMRKILGKTKGQLLIEQPFHCDFGYHIEVGENFYANYNMTILDRAKVTFGDNIFIAPNCSFYTAGHPLDVETRNLGLEYAYPISIGNNVWIGGSVTVLPGVCIGDNTVIGGGSVVTKDIPSNVVAAGNPCRVIREITDADNDRYKVL